MSLHAAHLGVDWLCLGDLLRDALSGDMFCTCFLGQFDCISSVR